MLIIFNCHLFHCFLIFGYQTIKIIASGGSAGGHLAAAAALTDRCFENTDDLSVSCIPNALVLFNPVIDNGPGGYGFEKIGEASDKMVQDMNEIVWALNITNDSLISLMSYIRQYVSSRLSASGINLEIREPSNYPEMFVSGRTRRNIFMIIKEIINNAIKYAGTKKIDMKILLDDNLRIIISDNGTGMPEKFTHQTINFTFV